MATYVDSQDNDAKAAQQAFLEELNPLGILNDVPLKSAIKLKEIYNREKQLMLERVADNHEKPEPIPNAVFFTYGHENTRA
ncbi:MAG: hypothetical protein INF44_07090 [Thalassospira sp.]|jgi:hypothetical protein|nr:hypothetical protein [Thalassospira sp.]